MKITQMTLKDLENMKDTLYSDFDNFWSYNVLKQELENENKFAFICHFNMTPAEKSVYGSSEREIGFFVEVLKDRDEYKINDFYTGL